MTSKTLIMRLAPISFVATLLATLAVAGWFAQERELKQLSEQLVVTVVCNTNAGTKEISTLETELKTISGIDSVQMKSANDVRSEFVSRFATSVSNTLSENPFPTVMLLHLKDDARTKDRIDTISAEVRSLRSVSDVVYRAAFINLVEERVAEGRVVRWVVGIVVVLVLCLLLWTVFSGIPLITTGLQLPAMALLVGAVAGFLVSLGTFYAVRDSVPSMNAVRPISLITGGVIVCAFGGIILGICAVLTVKNAPNNTSIPQKSTSGNISQETNVTNSTSNASSHIQEGNDHES